MDAWSLTLVCSRDEHILPMLDHARRQTCHEGLCGLVEGAEHEKPLSVRSRSMDSVSTNISSRCTGTPPFLCVVLFSISFIISVPAQNNGRDSTYPMGIDR